MSNTNTSNKRPLPISVINGVGKVLQRIGINLPSIDQASIIAAAKKQTGLDYLGPDDYKLGLERLINSSNNEAQLTQIGRTAAKASLVDCMSNRMQLFDYAKKHPEIREQKIEQPIFILGLPRTGTTILHATVAADPRNRGLMLWEMQRPFPPPHSDPEKNQPRILELDKNMKQLEMLAPEMKSKHESNPRLAEECLPMMGSAFFQEQFSTVNRMPSYREWYMNADAKPAYEYHKLFLQYLQSISGGRRWVLKSPLHLPFLKTILDVYPDACFVQTHRDPLKVLASVCSLLMTLRGAFSDAIDLDQIREEESTFFSNVVNRGLQARDELNIPNQFYDFQFDDVINKPIETISAMYQHFGFELSEDSASAMKHYLDNRPRSKHGKHHYTLEQYGLSEEQHGPLFAEYRERFVHSKL